ncbi:hypothetical protein VRRI112168_12950 [Vreelandella rituensis]
MTTYTPIAESSSFIVLEKYSKEWKVADSYQSEDALERELIQDLVNHEGRSLHAKSIDERSRNRQELFVLPAVSDKLHPYG